jgi:ATP-binding cassette subfamily C protein
MLVDGAPTDPTSPAWGQAVGYVPQTVALIDDTLRRNIAFGAPDPEIDEARVEDAVRAAQLRDVVAMLPQGLDTELGEHGVRLSGGQRQRVAIARALYRQPRLLVLDEATSALDNETEEAVSRAVESLMGRLTLVIVAHRLSTVRKCDRLFYFKDGLVAAAGSFEHLLATVPEFRNAAALGVVELEKAVEL